MATLLTIAMSPFALKREWQPGFRTVSGESTVIVEREADASVADATLDRAIAVVGVDVRAGGLNAFIVGNDLHVALYEYRCVGGALCELYIPMHSQSGPVSRARKSFFGNYGFRGNWYFNWSFDFW